MRTMPGMVAKKLCWLLFVCLLAPVSPVAGADDELDASRKRLDRIQQQIE